MINLDSLLKKQRHHFANKGRLVKAMVFPVVMYGCESWTIKKAEHRRIDNFELWCWRRLLWSLAWQEIEPVNPKGNQPWVFIGKTDAETEAPIFWPPDAKSWLIGKDPDARKDWGQEEKGIIKDGVAGWHHQLNGHELEQTPGNSKGQGSLVCYSPWGHKESDTTEQLNNKPGAAVDIHLHNCLPVHSAKAAKNLTFMFQSVPILA